MDEKQRYTFDIFVAFLTPVDTLTNSALLASKPSLTIALKILKTIEIPLTPMVGPSKNIQWWWCNIVKTIEKLLQSMVAWKKH